MGKPKRVTCEDCYFRQNMLCALPLSEPCVTFRPAEGGLRPVSYTHLTLPTTPYV